MKNHRLNSKRDEIMEKNYLKINNTNLDEKEVAELIIKEFNF